VLKASDTIAFVPGRVWTEAATGTNGVGTALALGHPVQIFSAEHFNRQIHGWTCSGAPVRDPESGETIGVLDLSSGIRVAHPNSLALVTAAAEMVAAQLTVELFERDARVKGRYLQRLGVDARQPSALVSPTGRMIAAVPAGWLPRRIPVPESGGGTVTLADGAQVEVEPLPRGEGFLVVGPGEGRTRGQPALRVRLLDRERGLLTVGGRVVTLSPRHSEMVALLILHPDGLTSEELAQQLYGDPAKRMSVRAEIARLRRVIGARCATNPYRLTGEVSSDLHDVERLLDLGRRQSARKLARGPLLPGAQAPAIVAAREQLERRLGRVGVPVLP
jgi:GAF domain